ncbi:hypothetical protein ABZ924_25945 [Streptomyces sp. NPDC046876]|uniref:hypothetical protein n=1 Tax=Streptomyces sp. NPDC046876 TaxID=3155616 RepID=UPI0033F8BEA4
MSTRSHVGSIGVCLAAAVALTACGGGTAKPAAGGSSRTPSASTTAAGTEPYADKTPAEIQLLASEYTRTATFKKARGTVTSEGTIVSVELSFANVDCAGTIKGEGLGRTDIHATPKVVYAKHDADALRAAFKGTKAEKELLVERAADRWLKVDATHSEAKATAYVCQLSNPATMVEDNSLHITRGGSATVDGQPAFMLTYPGSNGGTATDYIAAQGRPYLLKRTETGPEPYEVTYYDFETVTQLRAPADSEVVALE